MEKLKFLQGKKLTIGLLIFSVILVGIVSYFLYVGVDSDRQAKLGREVVMSLYNYNSLAEFDTNITKFESLVTPAVFTRMTANNSDRILSVYLKFRAKPCLVNIIESSPNYVIYSLVSEAMEPERIFIMSFRTMNGKVSQIREAELFAFQTTAGWDVDLDNLPERPADFEALPQDLPTPSN